VSPFCVDSRRVRGEKSTQNGLRAGSRGSLGGEWGEFPMESVGVMFYDDPMELITTVGASLAGVVMVLVGAYSIAAILFDDLAQ